MTRSSAPRFSASPPRPTCSSIRRPAPRASAGNGCWRCTPPPSATPGSAASKTCTPGCRRPSRKNSASASRASAGSATTLGRHIAENWAHRALSIETERKNEIAGPYCSRPCSTSRTSGPLSLRTRQQPATILINGRTSPQPARAGTESFRAGNEGVPGVISGRLRLAGRFCHAAAKTENHFHQTEHVNRAYRDKHGRSVPETIDYGLMHINSRKIGHDSVKDAHGNKFKIGEDVKTDWKANARAGVAILAEQYELAKLEQGPVTSEQDRAQQAYSGYNGGPGNRDRYLHERRDGLPRNPHDRNFLENYRGERARR